MALTSLLLLLLISSCQLQINIASSPITISVPKVQVSDGDTKMEGSKLEDIAEGLRQEAGDLTIPLVP